MCHTCNEVGWKRVGRASNCSNDSSTSSCSSGSGGSPASGSADGSSGGSTGGSSRVQASTDVPNPEALSGIFVSVSSPPREVNLFQIVLTERFQKQAVDTGAGSPQRRLILEDGVLEIFVCIVDVLSGGLQVHPHVLLDFDHNLLDDVDRAQLV